MVTDTLNEFAAALSSVTVEQLLSQGFWQNVSPVVNFLVFITVYSLLVWHFYRFIAKRDLFKLREHQREEKDIIDSLWNSFLFFMEYTLVFPLISFVFFLAYSGLLLFLAPELSLDAVLLTSIALISAIRITSYYSEDLSRDLAKLIPLILLGIFVLDPTLFSLQEVFVKFSRLPAVFLVALQYILFLMMLEWALRILYTLYAFLKAVLSYRRPVRVDEVEAAMHPSTHHKKLE